MIPTFEISLMSTQHTGLDLAEKVERRNYANKTHENASIVRTLFDLFHQSYATTYSSVLRFSFQCGHKHRSLSHANSHASSSFSYMVSFSICKTYVKKWGAFLWGQKAKLHFFISKALGAVFRDNAELEL